MLLSFFPCAVQYLYSALHIYWRPNVDYKEHLLVIYVMMKKLKKNLPRKQETLFRERRIYHEEKYHLVKTYLPQ